MWTSIMVVAGRWAALPPITRVALVAALAANALMVGWVLLERRRELAER